MTEPVEIRTVSAPEDIARIEALAREIWTQHYTPIIGKAQVEYMLNQFQSRKAIAADIASGYVYSLAYAGGQACGYSAVRFDPDALFLSKLYVSETFRGRGIARALLRAAEETARKRGLACIRLICNKHNASSLAAYARMGFSRVADVVTDIGGGFVMDDYVMEKTLPEQ